MYVDEPRAKNVILSAFGGVLKSRPMFIPPSAQYEFKLLMTREFAAFSFSAETVAIAPSLVQEKVGRFRPTGTTEGGLEVYELVDIS